MKQFNPDMFENSWKLKLGAGNQLTVLVIMHLLVYINPVIACSGSETFN